jgi:formylmethanofuran dehydrogenase subunit E
MNQELWDKTVAFHGHACPGLAYGFVAASAVLEHPELGKTPYGQLVCLTENDACGVDAIQCLLGCTLGKGNMIFKDTAKHAFSFYDRDTGKSLRLVAKPEKPNAFASHEERMGWILKTSPQELFDYKEPNQLAPEKERVFLTVTCEECGEPTGEHRMRLKNGHRVCLDCFDEYDKRW